jgi:CBS domain containing-hemolysin-like protein
MEALEKIPEVGDEFDAYGVSVKVLEMDGRRIEKLQIIDNRSDESEDEDADKSESGDEKQ